MRLFDQENVIFLMLFSFAIGWLWCAAWVTVVGWFT